VSLHPDPVTGAEDAVVDFTTVNMATSITLAAERRCSLCSEPCGYWVAFVGGTRAAELMRYTDPPACPPCAHAAIQLCPYIVVGRHRRARADRPAAGIVPVGASPTKPDAWVVGITRSFRSVFLADQGFTVYLPARFRTTHTYQYGPDGRINTRPTTRQG
jgi:hypothetical protein